MKRFLFIYLVSSFYCASQEIPKILDIKSPDVAAIGLYGKTPVSLSRGSIDISVPIHTLKEGNIQIPISLNYNSTGVKVNQLPSSVGTNWSLQAGGIITRNIKSYPDETNYTSKLVADYPLQNTEVIELSTGFFYNSNKLINIPKNSGELHTFLQNNYGIDFEPDEFIFNFNGYSGRFYYSQNGNWIVENLPGAEISFTLEKRQNRKITQIICENPLGSSCVAIIATVDFDVIKSFHFKTPDGLEYTFGEAETAFNYSRNDFPMDNVSWVLTKVYDPKSKQEVNFEYTDKTYIRSALEISYIENRRKTYSTWFNDLLFGPATSYSNQKRVKAQNVAGISKQLKRITSTNYEVNFENVESIQLNYDFEIINSSVLNERVNLIKGNNLSQLGSGFSGNDGFGLHRVADFGLNVRPQIDKKRYQLNTIEIKSKLSNRIIKGFYFDYTKDPNKRLYLKKIKETNENPYEFEYYHEGDLPNYLDDKWLIDHWGYFNNKTNPALTATFPLTKSIVEDHEKSKDPDENYTYYGSLKKITYPTRGYTEYEYENNRYIKSVNRESFTSLGYSLIDHKIEKVAGGLRVKTIKDYKNSDKLVLKRSFSYEGGILPFKPVYYIPDNSFVSFHGNSDSGSVFKTSSIIELQDYGNIPVQYSKVTERIIEENIGKAGKIEYMYSNYSDHPDQGYDATISPGLSDVSPGYKNDNARGKLLSRKSYNEDNTLIEEEINLYHKNEIYGDINAIQTNYYYSYGAGAAGAFAQATSYRISIDPFNLFEINTNKYFQNGTLSTTENRIYNNYNLLKRTTHKNSKGQFVTKDFFYVGDLETEKNKGLFIKDLGISTLIQENTSIGNKIINANLTTFLKNNNNDIVLDSFFKFENNASTSALRSPTLINNQILVDQNFNKEISFELFNEKGGLVHYIENDTENKHQLWGYNGEHVIAKIEGNITANQLINALKELNMNYSSLDVDFGYDEQNIISTFKKLREKLPHLLITSYTYIHGIGLSSITNPNGIRFDYDYIGQRLVSISDQNGNKIKTFDYNFKNSNDFKVDNVQLGNIINNSSENLIVNTNELDLSVEVLNHGSDKLTFTWVIESLDGEKHVYKTKEPKLKTKIIYDYHPMINVTCTVKDNYSFIQDTKDIELIVDIVDPYLDESSTFNNYVIKGGSGDFEYHWKITIEGRRFYGINIKTQSREFKANSGQVILKYLEGRPCFNTFIELKVSDLKTGKMLNVMKEKSISIVCPEEDPIPEGCFIAGTKILMSNGSQKNVEDVNIGDKVLTYDTNTREIKAGEVKNIATPEHTKFVEFRFENDTKNTNTLDHPYYVIGKGWSSYDPEMTKIKYDLEVNKIELGDNVLLFDETTKRVRKLKLTDQKLISKTQKTYNLEKVSENHNFFANGILVHNKSKD
ncbi:hypothetical protein OAC51_09480 [Flavobacteriaceae bacterium]|nr:hypothetical protein [Flavobacteriaceae bacterium]